MVVRGGWSKNKIHHNFRFVIGFILFVFASLALAAPPEYISQFPHPDDVQGEGNSQYDRDLDRAIRLEVLREAINYASAAREIRKDPSSEELTLQKAYWQAQVDTGEKYGTIIAGTNYDLSFDRAKRKIYQDDVEFNYLTKYFPYLVDAVRKAHDAKIAAVEQQKNQPRVIQQATPRQSYYNRPPKEEDNTMFWITFWGCIIGFIALIVWIRNKLKPPSQEQVAEWLMEEFGNTKEERREGIKANFARETGMIAMLVDINKPHRWRQFLERNLTTMPPIEKFALEVFYHLYNEGFMEANDFFLGRLGLFYADGQGLDINYSSYRDKPFKSKRVSSEQMQEIVNRYYGMNIGKAVTHALNRLERAYSKDPNNPVIAELHKKYAGNTQLGGGQFDMDISDFATPG